MTCNDDNTPYYQQLAAVTLSLPLPAYSIMITTCVERLCSKIMSSFNNSQATQPLHRSTDKVPCQSTTHYSLYTSDTAMLQHYHMLNTYPPISSFNTQTTTQPLHHQWNSMQQRKALVDDGWLMDDIW